MKIWILLVGLSFNKSNNILSCRCNFSTSKSCIHVDQTFSMSCFCREKHKHFKNKHLHVLPVLLEFRKIYNHISPKSSKSVIWFKTIFCFQFSQLHLISGSFRYSRNSRIYAGNWCHSYLKIYNGKLAGKLFLFLSDMYI